MTAQVAKQVAKDFQHDHKQATVKLAEQVTNGVKRTVIHVTWKKDKETGKYPRSPFTIADPTQAV